MCSHFPLAVALVPRLQVPLLSEYPSKSKKLKEWIKGCQLTEMLPFLENKNLSSAEDLELFECSVFAGTLGRTYSPDLVKLAFTSAYRPPSAVVNNGLANSKEWERIAPACHSQGSNRVIWRRTGFP